MKSFRSYNFKFRDITCILVLFLYLSRFPYIGDYSPIIMLPLVVIYVLENRFSKLSFNLFFTLLLFCIVYGSLLIYYGYGSLGANIGKMIYPICFLLLGYILVEKDINFNKTHSYIFVIVFTMSIFGFLSVKNALAIYGNIESVIFSIGRSALSVWDDSLISATILNMNFSLALSLASLILLPFREVKQGKLIKGIYIICLLLSIYSISVLGNRTGVVIIVLSFMFSILFSSKLSVRKVANLLGYLFLFLILLFLYDLNVFNVKSNLENSILYNRFDGNVMDNPRFTAWEKSLKGVFENPLGGKQTNIPLNYAHNMWLDVGYEGGFLPFLLLLIFTLISIVPLFVFINRNDNPKILKRMFIGFYTAFFITFTVEPVMQGGFVYFSIYSFMVGIIQRLNIDYKK